VRQKIFTQTVAANIAILLVSTICSIGIILYFVQMHAN